MRNKLYELKNEVQREIVSVSTVILVLYIQILLVYRAFGAFSRGDDILHGNFRLPDGHNS
jgi:hypothetical protein